MLIGEEFNVFVDTINGRYKVHVECTYASSQIYRFAVSAGGREMQLRTDYPFVYTQKKRTKPALWQIEKGEKPNSGSGWMSMVEAIEDYIKKRSS